MCAKYRAIKIISSVKLLTGFKEKNKNAREKHWVSKTTRKTGITKLENHVSRDKMKVGWGIAEGGDGEREKKTSQTEENTVSKRKLKKRAENPHRNGRTKNLSNSVSVVRLNAKLDREIDEEHTKPMYGVSLAIRFSPLRNA